jgi:hypothetical protein
MVGKTGARCLSSARAGVVHHGSALASEPVIPGGTGSTMRRPSIPVKQSMSVGNSKVTRADSPAARSVRVLDAEGLVELSRNVLPVPLRLMSSIGRRW